MERSRPPLFAPGGGPVDTLGLPETTLDLLFAALLLTASGAFIGGNLLLWESTVLQRSGPIALACLALLLIFYALARSLGSVTWGLVITYGLLLVMTYGRQPWLVGLVYGCAACGLLYALRFLRIARRQWGWVLLMGVIGVATAFAHFQPVPVSFDMLTRPHIAGGVHIDVLSNAAIAAMIKNYGVVSTGLHGLIETPYHVLSHRLVAGLSLLSGRGTFEVYGVVRQVLLIPLLIFGLVTCCVLLAGQGLAGKGLAGQGLERAGRPRVPIAWALACILLVLFPLLLSPWLFRNLYLVSESYLVSLGLFLLGLPLLFKARLAIRDLLLVLLLAVLIADAKLSVGSIYAGLWLTRLLFVRAGRPFYAGLATLSVLVAVALVTVEPIAARLGWLALDPLHFIRTYHLWTAPSWLPLAAAGTTLLAGPGSSWGAWASALLITSSFFLLHFPLSWALLGWVAYHRGIPALLKEPVALYSVAALGAGVTVVLLFSLLDGNVYFFSNVAFFVALPPVLALLTHKLERRRVTNTAVLLFGILVILGSSLRDYYLASALSPLQPARPGVPHPFVASLLRIRDTMPVNVVMEPDSATVVTDNPLAPYNYCTSLPFVFPALSERPWIHVIPARDDCRYPRHYGFTQYGITGTRPTVTVEPRLLPGMTVHRMVSGEW